MPHAIFVIGMVIFLITFLTIVHRLEKRLVWPYSELQEPYFDDPTGYGARWVSVAVQSGFTLLGWARDLKGETYRISYAMLVSPDRTTLPIIGVGTLLKMPLQGTWMHTPSLDGRSFYSTDKQAGVQIDLSGNWRNQLAPEPGFVRLWQRHRAWIRDLAIAPRLYPGPRVRGVPCAPRTALSRDGASGLDQLHRCFCHPVAIHSPRGRKDSYLGLLRGAHSRSNPRQISPQRLIRCVIRSRITTGFINSVVSGPRIYRLRKKVLACEDLYQGTSLLVP